MGKIINYAKILLELILIAFFFYSSSSLFCNHQALALRIWIVTISLFISFIIQGAYFNKNRLKDLLNLNVAFFVAFSAIQALANICILKGAYAPLFEVIHYLLVGFIFAYNSKKTRYIDTGLVLFIIYSFRVFDASLMANEFMLLHAFTLLLGVLWIEDVYTKKIPLVKVNSLFIPWGLLVISGVISTINAFCPYDSLTQLMILVNFSFAGFLIAQHVKNISQIKLFIFTLFSLGGILLTLIINEIFLKRRFYYILQRLWIELEGPFRIHPNTIAGCFAVLLCLLLANIHFFKKKILRICVGVLMVAMLSSLLITYSRLGTFSFMLGVGILFIFQCRRMVKFIKSKKLLISLVLIFTIGLVVFTPLSRRIIQRISDSGSSSQTFYSCWNSLKAAKDNVLLGCGLDNYYILAKYAKEQICGPGGIGLHRTRGVIWTPSHSLYVGIAFGLGIIGLMCFIWLLFSVIRYFVNLNRYIADKKFVFGLLHGFFAAFITVIVHGILAMTFHLTILPAFFWVLIGLIISVGNVVNFNKRAAYIAESWKILVVLLGVFLVSGYLVICPVIAEKKYSLALWELRSGNPDGAAKSIAWAKKIMPINPKFYELSGEIGKAKGQIDEAIKFYGQALGFRRDFAFYHTNLGRLHLQKRMYGRSLVEFETAIDLDKYGVCGGEHYSDLGGFYNGLGRREEAVRQFKKALLVNPEVGCNVDWRGRSYLDEILKQIQQDYLISKDKDLAAANQILANLKLIKYCTKKESMFKKQ